MTIFFYWQLDKAERIRDKRDKQRGSEDSAVGVECHHRRFPTSQNDQIFAQAFDASGQAAVE